MNWALLLITEGISLLDSWKYANSMLICTSNYVPFNMRLSGTFTPYLAGKFIQCGASKNESGLSGGTIVCEDGMLHSTSPCLLTSLSDCFRCSFLSRDGCSKRKILLKRVENMWSLFPKNKRHRNMNCSTRCRWRQRASWCVQRVCIISEPPQCQLLRNREKRLLFLAWRQCNPRVIRRD